MLLLNPAVECEDGCGIVRHPVVRPGSEMEVGHFERTLRAASQLQGKTHTNYDTQCTSRLVFIIGHI